MELVVTTKQHLPKEHHGRSTSLEGADVVDKGAIEAPRTHPRTPLLPNQVHLPQLSPRSCLPHPSTKLICPTLLLPPWKASLHPLSVRSRRSYALKDFRWFKRLPFRTSWLD